MLHVSCGFVKTQIRNILCALLQQPPTDIIIFYIKIAKITLKCIIRQYFHSRDSVYLYPTVSWCVRVWRVSRSSRTCLWRAKCRWWSAASRRSSTASKWCSQWTSVQTPSGSETSRTETCRYVSHVTGDMQVSQPCHRRPAGTSAMSTRDMQVSQPCHRRPAGTSAMSQETRVYVSHVTGDLQVRQPCQQETRGYVSHVTGDLQVRQPCHRGPAGTSAMSQETCRYVSHVTGGPQVRQPCHRRPAGTSAMSQETCRYVSHVTGDMQVSQPCHRRPAGTSAMSQGTRRYVSHVTGDPQVRKALCQPANWHQDWPAVIYSISDCRNWYVFLPTIICNMFSQMWVIALCYFIKF